MPKYNIWWVGEDGDPSAKTFKGKYNIPSGVDPDLWIENNFRSEAYNWDWRKASSTKPISKGQRKLNKFSKQGYSKTLLKSKRKTMTYKTRKRKGKKTNKQIAKMCMSCTGGKKAVQMCKMVKRTNTLSARRLLFKALSKTRGKGQLAVFSNCKKILGNKSSKGYKMVSAMMTSRAKYLQKNAG